MATTNITTLLLQETIESFKIRLPALGFFNPVFMNKEVVKGQTVRAHIPSLPAVSTYDGTTGYANGATDSQSLYTDVDVTMSQLSHVPVKIDYLDQIASQVDIVKRCASDLAYVLAKTVCDYVLGKAVAANFTQTITAASPSKDTLDSITQTMNTTGAGDERFGIINSAAYTSLEADTRLASKDYAGQTRTASPWGRFANVAGFREIIEYPAFPANSINLSGVFFDRRAFNVVTALPKTGIAMASAAGIPQQGLQEVVTDPATGLSMLGIQWQAAGTFDNYLTVALLYDCVAGANAGGAGVSNDYAGHLMRSA